MFTLLSSWLRRNPTAEWRETVAAPPIDVVRGQVMGLGFRSRSEAFRSLGPAEAWPGKNGNGLLSFPAKGLDLEFEHDQLIGVLVTYIEMERRPGHAAFRPFAGSLLAGGSASALRVGDNEGKVIAVVGPDCHRDDDEDETILRYTFGDVVAEFEFDKPGGFARISIFLDGEGKPS